MTFTSIIYASSSYFSPILDISSPPFFFHNFSFDLFFDGPLSLNHLFGFEYSSVFLFISIS